MNSVIGALRVVLGLDSAAFDKGLSEAQSRLARFGPALKKGLAAAGAAAATAGAAIGLAVKGALDEADELSKLSSKIGVPIEDLSRLKYAADLSGVSIQGVANGFKKLSTNLNEAVTGNQSAGELFTQLGVAATNADGSLRSSSAVLLDVADKFAAMEDGAQKTALAVQLFGKSGLDLIPLLNGGAAGLKQMTDEADALGLTISSETGKAAEEFNDNISRLQATLTGLVNQITANLAPTLARISDFLVQVSTAFRGLSPEVQTFISVGAALTVALAALAVPLGLVVAGIAAIGVPIAATIAGVAALTAAVVAFWPEIQAAWEWVKKLADIFVQLHTVALQALIQKFQELGTTIKTALADAAASVLAAFQALPGQMMEIGRQIIDGLWQGIKAQWESIKGGVTDIASGIKDSFTSFFDIHSPSRVMEEIGMNIMQGLGIGMNNLRGDVVGVAGGVASDVKGSFGEIENASQSLGSSFSSAFKSVIDGSKSVKEALADLLGSLSETWMNQAFQALLGGGGVAGSSGGLLGTLFGGFGSLLGFANGGSFQVGGAGGIDSQLVAFRASPNETVSITKPGQERAMGGNMHVTFSADVDKSGNLMPFVTSVSDERIQRAAPGIIGAASRQVVPVMAGYQNNKAGGDYRG